MIVTQKITTLAFQIHDGEKNNSPFGSESEKNDSPFGSESEPDVQGSSFRLYPLSRA